MRTKKHRDKANLQAAPTKRPLVGFHTTVVRMVYDNLDKDWKNHTRSTENIRSKQDSLNVIMPPAGGVGSSKFKQVWMMPADNSDSNAVSEARCRRLAWELHEELRKKNYMYEDEEGGKTYEEDELTFFRYATPGVVPPENHPAHGEVRPLIVDSGASQHMICESHLNEYEKLTIKDLEKPMRIHTANGKVKVTKSCQIWVHELEMYVTAVILPKTAECYLLGLSSRRTDSHIIGLMGSCHIWRNATRTAKVRNESIAKCNRTYRTVSWVHTPEVASNPGQALTKASQSL